MSHRLHSAPGKTAPSSSPPSEDCKNDPIAGLKAMFVDQVQAGRILKGQEPARRPVFLRLHGVARGTFIVRPDLPEDLRVGVFAGSSYPAWVRFSSDIPDGSPDLKTTVGIGIKVFDVPGKKLLSPEEAATTHDFLLQNHDVFFVDTAKDMCEFTQASLNGKFDEYVKDHPATGKILEDMAKVVKSVLSTDYWSVLPYRCGSERYVKYKLEPEFVPPAPGEPNLSDPFYLHADLKARLENGEMRFRFLVQRRTHAATMPLDAATVRWSEELSPPLHVATLVLPAQDVDARGQAAYGENLAFNPWHALAEHAPVGSIADARKVVYKASADLRRNVNGVPLGEPAALRPQNDDTPAARDTRVVRASIHPAIGVARLGNSPTEYFIGPEVVEPRPEAPGFYKDSAGALKRQAARFRIFGYNAAGEVVGELTPNNADLRWTVHVANRKAAAYQFVLAMDIPEAATVAAPLRNKGVTGDARQKLVIDPGPRSIAGENTQGDEYHFNTGRFLQKEVYLGELRTDEAGRLLFLGGFGNSGSPEGTPIYDESDPNGFANANGWYDDTSDGPVTAEVSIDGRSIPVDPAWVITAPPNYAPNVISIRTLYDSLYDSYVAAGWLPFPEKVSFRRDIFPILQRLVNLQWVNKGFAAHYGWDGRGYFLEPRYLAKLANPKETYAELRRQVLNAFRSPTGKDNNPLPWPWVYGDAMNVPAASTPRQNMALSPTQYRFLQLWAEGRFEADWEPSCKVSQALEDLPIPEQPAMLDQAALHFCLADAFHPGTELTWPMRHTSLYEAPFRIRHRPPAQPEPDYGAMLTQETVLRPGGPLYAQGPGDLTRWMALPWQADTASCRSGYERDYDPYLPTFWPARVPNQVLAQGDYKLVMNTELPREERLQAFSRRKSWFRLLQGSAVDQMKQMVTDFGKFGVVEVRDGTPNDADFPPVMLVESPLGAPEPPSPGERARRKAETAGEVSLEETERARKLEEAGWESEEVAADFLRLISG
jgi:hypothetical protein